MYIDFNGIPGNVGDTKKANGLTYVKARNGKWLLKRNKALRKLLTDLHVHRKLTLRKIHEETGIPHSSIQSALNDFELMRSKKQASHEANRFIQKNLKTIKRMYYVKGMTFAEIALIVEKKTGRKYKPGRFGRYFKNNEMKRRRHCEAIAMATLRGRRHRMPRGQVVFASHSVNAWIAALEDPIKDLTPQQYKRKVQRFTGMVIKRFPQMFPPEYQKWYKPQGYHIDHMFSVSSGYYKLKANVYVERRRKVPLEIMCHPVNLQLILGTENMTKGSRNAFSLKELKRRIEKYERLHGDIFDDYYGKFTATDIVNIHRNMRDSK